VAGIPGQVEESVAIEMGDAGKNYLQTYLAMAGRVAGGDFTAILDSPIAATVVEHVLQMVPEDVKGPERIIVTRS